MVRHPAQRDRRGAHRPRPGHAPSLYRICGYLLAAHSKRRSTTQPASPCSTRPSPAYIPKPMAKRLDIAKVTPYQRNHNALPQGMAECLGYLDAWKKIWPGDCFCYEYHFWRHQYFDPSGLYLAKLLYDDIQALRKHGLNGIVEDGSQRSFFPTGFAYYVYGETLFDAQVSLRVPGGRLFQPRLRQRLARGPKIPAKRLRTPGLRLSLRPEIAPTRPRARTTPRNTRKRPPKCWPSPRASRPPRSAEYAEKYRAATVSWQLLRYFLEYAAGIAKMVIPLANGDGELAEEKRRVWSTPSLATKSISNGITTIASPAACWKRWSDKTVLRETPRGRSK